MSTQKLPHREPPPRNLQLQYTTPLSNNHLYTEVRHKAKTTITSTQRGKRHKAKLHHNHLSTRGIITNSKHNHLYTRGICTKSKQKKDYNLVISIDHKQLLVITIEHQQYFAQKQDPIDRIEMIAQV